MKEHAIFGFTFHSLFPKLSSTKLNTGCTRECQLQRHN